MADEQPGPNPEIVRLFPLSGVVLLPHGVLPLHIFEERYRQMTQHALADDRCITLVHPTGESLDEPVPIQTVGCRGHICQERKLPDGRFVFHLRGLHRIRIDQEIDIPQKGKPILYRKANFTILEDHLSQQLKPRREGQRSEIVGILQRLLPKDDKHMQTFLDFLSAECDASIFSDYVGFVAPISMESKLELLGTRDVDLRLEIIVKALREAVGDSNSQDAGTFPPTFSPN